MTRRVSATLAPTPADNRDRLRAMGAVAARFAAGAWRPAVDVLVAVRAVPTIFPQVDWATRVHGWPTDRVALVHGPSNNGKTAFVHGLGLSFLQADHFYAYVDAEYTTPSTWLAQLMSGYATHPGFAALRPTSYESTVDAVRQWCETIGEAKAKGELSTETTGLCVIDSIRKLVPKRLLEALLKEGADGADKKGPGGRKRKAGGIDGMSGRGAMYKAALNSQWLDELVPLLAHTGTAMIIIAREIEDPDAGAFDARDWKVGGGKALYYDSSLVARVVRDSWVRDGEGSSALIYGEKISVEIHKTKVGGKEERVPEAYFHLSNGVLTPEGYDRARDVLDMAVDRDVVAKAGSHYTWGRKKLGNGKHAAVQQMTKQQDLLVGIETEVRDRMRAALISVKESP